MFEHLVQGCSPVGEYSPGLHVPEANIIIDNTTGNENTPNYYIDSL